MTKKYKIRIPYKPRPLQAVLHKSLKRFNVIVCHRRFGKTVFALNEIIAKALMNKRNTPKPSYGYIAPYKNQAKDIAWDYLKEFTKYIPEVKYNQTELTCTLPNGAQIKLYGADNPDNLRGQYFDGVVLDEIGDMPKSIWTEAVRPMLADHMGWAIFIGTPKGQNYFHEVYEKSKLLDSWHSAMYKASETGIIIDSELKEAEAEMGEEEFEQEFECSFTAAVKGTYYGKIMEQLDKNNQIREIPFDPNVPVVTAWDLGMNDKTCIWFAQEVAGEMRIIDYYEASNEALPHYARVLNQKPYLYGYHILPHDAKQRSLGTGKTSQEVLKGLGLKTKIAPRVKVQEGINAVKSLLPKCFFHARECYEGLIALRNYRSQFNDKTGTFSKTPLHDSHSHAADAFRYLATMFKPQKNYDQILQQRQHESFKRNQGEYDPFGY